MNPYYAFIAVCLVESAKDFDMAYKNLDHNSRIKSFSMNPFDVQYHCHFEVKDGFRRKMLLLCMKWLKIVVWLVGTNF